MKPDKIKAGGEPPRPSGAGTYSVRTDLALEAREMRDEDEIDGVEAHEKDFFDGKIKVTWVEITNERGAKALGKPMGNYVTLEAAAMKENDVEAHEEIIKILSKHLAMLHKLDKKSSILIVGLGNWNVTPDALGPKVVSKVLVTRHIRDLLPDNLSGGVRAVSAISPGVMGLTGIETGEIIKGVVERIKPDLVIAIDALAARKTARINATIQMSDTCVNPGSGMGNKRMRLDDETLGVPVLAIGVPTVVDAATLVNDTMESMLSQMLENAEKGSEFYEMLRSMAEEERYSIITEILSPYAGNMFVTPKEVDAVIDRLSNIIANALNIALHPGIGTEDINRYLYL
ncbi:MAG: GPR endopeptidase [Defluviitaleaceae bacterium]|nr:GPR endopeptidase [Defluviitaleaceae bacterium]